MCYAEIKFLRFFFRQLKLNKTENYADSFPYLSLCGPERNFIRCDDLPIVFTHLLKERGDDVLSYGHVGPHLVNKFEPSKLFMDPDTGRVYHPVEKKPLGVGLIRSQLAIELSPRFRFEGEGMTPKSFIWNDKEILLDNSDIAEALKHRIRHPMYLIEDDA